ncbi:MAG: ABC transporter permease [Bacteroidota bacterium]
MNKIILIIQREFITRVRKKSFIVMSILGPILFAAFLIVPSWLATLEDTEVKTIAIVDETHLLGRNLPETEYIKFNYLHKANIEILKDNFENLDYYGILYIPENILASNTSILYADKQPSLSTRMHISNALEEEIENQKLKAENIENLDKILRGIETKINLRNITFTEEGEEKESHAGIAMGIGYVGGMLIYFFIFLFGAMVMRGVIEEKSNRIVEVIVSSVRPFQLMMGKIIGVGLVGLSQFIIWVVLTVILVLGIQRAFFPELSQSPTQKIISQDIMSDSEASAIEAFEESNQEMELLEEIFASLDTVNFGMILGMFIFFFLAGYLLYASFFAMIGSAVDNETDTQQFMFPVTVPLIIGIFVMINTIQNPEGSIAFWFSIIPLTSPIVMMVRIPFNPPVWELVLSMLILILTFIGSVWMAGKIYRTGILMYGKKVNYKELWKWLRYKS